MTHLHARLIHGAAASAAVFALASSAWAAPAPQTAGLAYKMAQTREQTARKNGAPLSTLRAIATSYENIVRRHPTSGFADNALWQGAGLYQLAYERGSVRRDRDDAARLLKWLKKEYPNSPFAKQVDDRIAALAPRETPPAAAPASASPTRATPPASPAAPPAPKAAPAPSKAASGTVVAVSTTAAPGVRATPLPPLAEVFREFPIALRDATYAPLPKGERLTIELSQEVTHGIEAGSTPQQVWLTLPGVGVTPAVVDAAAKVHGTMLRGVRISPRPDGLAVKLDLAADARYSTFPLYDPYRIVVDVDTDAAAAAAAPTVVPAVAAKVTTARGAAAPVAAKAAARGDTSTAVDATPASAAAPENRPLPPASTKAGGYSLARQLGLGVSRIVIDPGHGGHDPGAQANGVSEAELVLDVAKRLEALLLDQPGVEVVLTRRTNEFIPLEERTAIANRENADLFLSIHANSSPQHDTRGIETYVLNFASNPQAEAVAARENASSAQAMGGLPQLVKAITLNNKLTESRELAAQVQTSMTRRLSAQNKTVKDLGVKQAPFVVLIGAQMPSVLAEISFLTNKADASLLKQGAYRQRIAQALCDAVVNYQTSLKKVGTVAEKLDAR